MSDGKRRARWVLHLGQHTDRQDLTCADRIAIFSILLGREIARLPEDSVPEELTSMLVQVAHAEQAARDSMRDAALRLAIPAGRA